ncbi:hypothetical protein E4U21_004898 [Claviceps maximensis]|nr:hypothetical protein E4U21_004898 [Claviceps maximensis]
MLCTICRALRQQPQRAFAAFRPRRTTTPSVRRPQSILEKTNPHPTSPRFYTSPPQRSPQQQQEQEQEQAASQEQPSMSAAEESIAQRLRQELQPTELLVRDVSGGCGSMYAIDIASPAFRGASMLTQQRMVNKALGDIMRGWHGLQLNTRVSK